MQEFDNFVPISIKIIIQSIPKRPTAGNESPLRGVRHSPPR